MPTQRGLNLSLIAAMSKSGLIHYRTVVKGINSELFQSFLGKVSSLIGEENPASFFDNCRSHLNATGLFQSHHTKRLPPYSSFLNPIEEMFSFLKTRIPSKLAAHSDFHLQLNSSAKIEWLRNEIKQCLVHIDETKCKTWIKHSKTFYPKCILEENIE